jgi:pyruvate,orthophosphate dikinase
MKTYVYSFGEGQAEGSGSDRDLLGGKGAGLAEMARIGIPVPPGFTITTEACVHYIRTDGQLPEGLDRQEKEALSLLEKRTGARFGDPENPLLVSVRSGGKYSMPGMMDTVLNLGLNDKTVAGLEKRTDNARFAYDTYRRLIMMFGDVVLGIERDHFENLMRKKKQEKGVESDLDLDATDLKELTDSYKDLTARQHPDGFPQDPMTQLHMARDAVFRSWNNPRAKFYRKDHGIPESLGTAVNVQTMVFGNLGPTSGTGVGFTRNPATGVDELYGEFLYNAQGEDVVAGVRNVKPIRELKDDRPELYEQIYGMAKKLEKHFRDMQDFEFTFEDKELFMLQTRSGKRTGPAAVKAAVDMVQEGLIDKTEAVLRVEPAQLDQLLHPRIDPDSPAEIIAKGLGASPGAAVGGIVFDPDDAVKAKEQKKKVLLIRNETSPDDIHGMDAAQGILTATGGMTSHAAVVARGKGKPCVVGCATLQIDEKERTLKIGGNVFREGDSLAINGTTGEVLAGEIRTVEPAVGGESQTLLQWADEIRALGVRTNADTPKDAQKAREFGAAGIGLCRTEHMFFGEERFPWVQQMILYASAARNAKLSESPDREGQEAMHKFQEALDHLLPFQREDFYGLFKAMEGLPVTVRLLDPPLHEFLPNREELMVEVALKKSKGEDVSEKEALLKLVEELHEFNPMMGHRGCRLGITFPEISAMQSRAIIEAACQLKKEGVKVLPEIMVPLIGTAEELANQRKVVEEVAGKVMEEMGVPLEYLVGTMIEVPRAALTADEVAKVADFFSFGTNDLTQMTYAYSRDDAGKFLRIYVGEDILPGDPFVSIDTTGVGQLVDMATQKGRASRPNLKVGICGEHGGDPASIAFCHKVGLDYVSCSPYRVPIARLAAAQAKVKAEEE